MASQKRALDAVLTTAWAITPDYLELIASIAERENEYAGNLQALEAKLGRPLGNTMTTTVRDGIAVIPIEGPLFKRASLFQAMSGATDYTTVARDLTAALEDPAVSAVMLQIDSPGGEVGGTSDLAAMIAAAGKPVWAHIDGMGASAAYWLASAADRIIASPTSAVGSVGVQMGYTAREPRAGEKTYRFVSSQSPNKNADPATEAGAVQVQTMVDDLAQVFIDTVAANRGVESQFVLDNFGQGAVMVASKAVASGMIDGVNTFEAAFASLKQELNAMNYAELTAQALAENRPDLVAAIRTEALATVQPVDAQAIRAEAAKAERERIVAIEALAMPGADAIIEACKADGTDPAQAAVKIVQHMRSTQAQRGTAALDNIKKAETGMTPPTASSQDDDMTAEQKAASDMEALRKAGVIR